MPRPPRTDDRDRYTLDSLLEVAVRVFNERGYDGTSMAELAAAAGITKSSIYHHARGKEHLLRLAVARALDALFAVLDEPPATTGPAADRLAHVVRRTTETLIAELPYVTLLLRVRGNTETEQWALQRRREFDRQVATLVAEALAGPDADQPAGWPPAAPTAPGTPETSGPPAAAPPPPADPRLATRLAFGMINSMVEWYRPDRSTAGGRRADDRVVEEVTRFVLAGLGLAPRG